MTQFERLTKGLARSLGYTADQLLSGFSPAEMEDLDAVIRFRKENLGVTPHWDEKGYFTWRYSFSVPDSGMRRGNDLWLVKIDGEILGMIGAQRMPLQVDSETVEAIHPMDLLVANRINGGGLGAWMQLALNRTTDILVVIGANDNSASMVQRIFHPMPSRPVWKLMLNTRDFLLRHIGIGFVAGALSVVLNPWFRGMVYLKIHRHIDAGLEARDLSVFPQEVEQLSRSHGGGFLFRPRSADFLNWKFVENPNMHYERVGYYRSGQLVGYVVTQLSDATPGRSFTVKIVDFLWREEGNIAGRSGLPEALFAATIVRFRKRGASLIKVSTYGARARGIVKAVGFIQRDENLLFSLSCNVSELESTVYQPERWFLTDADAHAEAC